VGALPPVLANFVNQGAKALGCDHAFFGLPILAACAGVIGNTRTIQLKPDWHEPCVVWACVVADSGTLKSPACKKVLWPVRRLEMNLAKEFKEKRETYRLQ